MSNGWTPCGQYRFCIPQCISFNRLQSVSKWPSEPSCGTRSVHTVDTPQSSHILHSWCSRQMYRRDVLRTPLHRGSVVSRPPRLVLKDSCSVRSDENRRVHWQLIFWPFLHCMIPVVHVTVGRQKQRRHLWYITHYGRPFLPHIIIIMTSWSRNDETKSAKVSQLTNLIILTFYVTNMTLWQNCYGSFMIVIILTYFINTFWLFISHMN